VAYAHKFRAFRSAVLFAGPLHLQKKSRMAKALVMMMPSRATSLLFLMAAIDRRSRAPVSM
jgi:hypothetical protein